MHYKCAIETLCADEHEVMSLCPYTYNIDEDCF